jgi:hypothetical protein
MGKKPTCSLSYHRLPDEELDDFATGVRVGLQNNLALFPTPPVLPPSLQALIDDYEVKRSAYKRGGLDQKPAFEQAKTLLMNGLDDNAAYVDSIADGNEAIIVAAGYVPTNTTTSPSQVPSKPEVRVKRGEASGQLLAECKPIKGAQYFGCIVSEGSPLEGNVLTDEVIFLSAGSKSNVGMNVAKDRKKVFSGLQPGTTYYFYFYAVNAAGVSALSDAVSIMAA